MDSKYVMMCDRNKDFIVSVFGIDRCQVYIYHEDGDAKREGKRHTIQCPSAAELLEKIFQKGYRAYLEGENGEYSCVCGSEYLILGASIEDVLLSSLIHISGVPLK